MTHPTERAPRPEKKLARHRRRQRRQLEIGRSLLYDAVMGLREQVFPRRLVCAGCFLLLAGCVPFALLQEARNTLFCPSPEKLHTVVLQGVRNISDTP